MKWFQIKEQSAGRKRLILSWYLYKIFGKNILYLIAFLVSFFTFIFAPKVRAYSRKYFLISYPYLKTKPTLYNQLKHIYSYSESLVDKILMYCNDFNPENVVFDNNSDKENLYEDIKKGNGAFFICSHIGNVEIFQSHFLKKYQKSDLKINIFTSHAQSQIFNEFLEKIKIDFPVIFFPVEEIGINTAVDLKENLNKGQVVFIAGDRLSQNNTKCIKEEMFKHNISLPKGTFKLAKLMQVPTYFISAVKYKNKYRIILEPQKELKEEQLRHNFIKYMERILEINPFQFFNFYDFFS